MLNFATLLQQPTGYHARKAAGVCVEPGCKQPLVEGCVRCRTHLDAINLASRATRAKAAARSNNGVPPRPRLRSADVLEGEPRDRSRGDRLGPYMIMRDSEGRLISRRIGPRPVALVRPPDVVADPVDDGEGLVMELEAIYAQAE